MALYHFTASIISRSNGCSAISAAAYRSGEKITNDYDGLTSDYRKKQNVALSVILLPENAPAEFADRSILWNSVEQNEKQKNAQLAREYEFSLPRELPQDARERIALEFVEEHLVAEGMIADVCFHNPPKMNSKKQPLDEDGNVTKDPARYVYANPHAHVLTPLRPVDETGKWAAKRQKVYICEKDGVEGRFTAQKLKANPGWEKLYHYKDASGSKSWHTKTYVSEHPEEGLTLIGYDPKCETIVNPVVERWNSVEMLNELREAWAIKVNAEFEKLGMDERIDHRSYKDQGLDIIPTVHEGKAVTIAEKRLCEEYEARIARGEDATPRHTEVRELNMAIREHNTEVRMIAEIKKLQEQLRNIIEPVVERLEVFKNSIAENLERIRDEIVSLTVRIRKAVDIKGRADEKIAMNEAYLKDLNPGRWEHVAELRTHAEELTKRLETASVDEIYNLQERIENIKNAVGISIENVDYARSAEAEIARLKKISEIVGEHIEKMKAQRYELKKQYEEVNSNISDELRPSIDKERIELRPGIEAEYIDEDAASFKTSVKSIDEDLGCSYSNALSEKEKISLRIS